MSNKKRYMINFDLNQDMLKMLYPNKLDYKNAYKDIKNFLLANGFEWNQGSGYISQDYMSNMECKFIILKLQQKFKWFNNTATVCTLTEIGNTFNLLDYIKRNEKIVNDLESIGIILNNRGIKNKGKYVKNIIRKEKSKSR